MFKCTTTWLRPQSGSVISPCNNARRDYLRRRWWRANRNGEGRGTGGLLVREMEEGGDHEWKGWVVVSLSTRADGYLSRLINDAYVNRLWSLPRTSPLIRKVRFASSEIGDYPSRWSSFLIGQFIYGPVRAAFLSYATYLKSPNPSFFFYRSMTLIAKVFYLKFSVALKLL